MSRKDKYAKDVSGNQIVLQDTLIKGTADAPMSKATECKAERVVHNRKYDRNEKEATGWARLLIGDKCATGFGQCRRCCAHMEIRGKWEKYVFSVRHYKPKTTLKIQHPCHKKKL